MIKAVSRQILEVSETGNAYFTKAWLMVAPSCMSDDISNEAENYLRTLDPPSELRSRGNPFKKAARYLCSAAVGGLVTALLIQLY
ncbi:MAG: hypothetical protein IIZ59_02840 [Clostridia bacterium]|nr:hypothetical protein [Clostridia bacterium]